MLAGEARNTRKNHFVGVCARFVYVFVQAGACDREGECEGNRECQGNISGEKKMIRDMLVLHLRGGKKRAG